MVILTFMLCSQICPTGWTAFLGFAYLGSLGVNVVGILLGENGPAMLKLRWIGLVASSFIGWIALWTIVGDWWCRLFYFSKFFSSDFYS